MHGKGDGHLPPPSSLGGWRGRGERKGSTGRTCCPGVLLPTGRSQKAGPHVFQTPGGGSQAAGYCGSTVGGCGRPFPASVSPVARERDQPCLTLCSSSMKSLGWGGQKNPLELLQTHPAEPGAAGRPGAPCAGKWVLGGRGWSLKVAALGAGWRAGKHPQQHRVRRVMPGEALPAPTPCSPVPAPLPSPSPHRPGGAAARTCRLRCATPKSIPQFSAALRARGQWVTSACGGEGRAAVRTGEPGTSGSSKSETGFGLQTRRSFLLLSSSKQRNNSGGSWRSVTQR